MENRTFAAPSPGTAALVPEPARAVPHTPPRTLRARRRRPAVLAMAVALIAAGGLGGAVLYNSTGQRIAVLALAHDVPMGQALTADDVVVARIAGDPALRPLDARDRARTIGLRATTDLRRGALLLKADVTADPAVEPGQQIVGVAAKRSQLPATRLEPGLRVLVVATVDQANQGGTTRTPDTLAATVVTVGRVDSDGGQVVDVAVPPADGPRLAAWVAGGKFQVILAPRAAAPAAQAPSDGSSNGPSTGSSTGPSAALSGAPSTGGTAPNAAGGGN
ncbi:SAF domain-containing protein [Kitasatospora sp. NPDC001175]|uniref:SAF domain-containing protein n=1 Tax=Kitasatospora sp. NPDC001175 TaxID=3157103 RepID=UPI003CFDF302